MTCHATNQINQHMAERESDLELEALRDKCDELESMEMLCSECNLPMKDHDCPISAASNLRQGLENARAERDRLQSKLTEETAIVDKVWAALGVKTFEDAKGKAVWEIVAALQSTVAALERAVEATLLFHSGSPWDYEKQQRWQEIARTVCGRPTDRSAYGMEILAHDATTKTLCNIQRAALAALAEPKEGGK